MREIDRQLKANELKNLYVLYGEEDYLKKFYKNKLIKATVAEGDTMNFTTVEGPCADAAEIITLINTLPFFAKQRVILIEKSGLFTRADEAFAACLSSMPETAMAIFVEEKVNLTYASSKAVKKYGELVKLDALEPKELEHWGIAYLKRAGKQITTDAWAEFTDRTPASMDFMEKELSKLVDYCWDRDSITKADVAAIVTQQPESRIFEMISGIAEKNPAKVMRNYHNIIEDKAERPAGILSLITRQFRQMLWVKSLQEARRTNEEIREELGLAKESQVYRIGRVAENFSEERIYDILSDITFYDEAIKRGEFSDRMAIEMLIMKYSK